MNSQIDRILIDRDSIADRVEQLAIRLVRDLGPAADKGSLVVIPIMTGSLFFTADLVRRLPLSFRIHPVMVSSYPGKSKTSQGILDQSPLPAGLEGRTVLIIDDILDFSKIESGKLKLEKIPFSPRAIIEDVTLLLQEPTLDL